MRCDGYYSDTDFGRRQRRRREICRSFTCISPWFIFCRWFNGRKSSGSRNRRFMERKWEKEKMEGNLDNHEASSCSRNDVSAQIGQEASVNFGVGFGLIYLVRYEINKMVELQSKIESLLQNLQMEFQNQEKRPLFMPTKSRISSSFSNTGVQETMYAEEEHDSSQYLSSHDVRRSEVGSDSNRYRREKSLRMDQLEQELEAEFDRLQLHMDSEFCSEINVEDSAPEWSQNTCFEEVITGENVLSNDEYYYGVPPMELERKLHEVLETRQQERINELESALDYAMQQLDEKERELSWWKDTACLISQHLPAIPTLLSQVKRATLHTMGQEFEGGKTGKSLVIKELHV